MSDGEDGGVPVFGHGDWVPAYTAGYQTVTVSDHIDALNTTFGSLGNMTNTGGGGSSGYMPRSGSDTIRYIVAVSYIATFIVGVLGNTLVLYIIARFSEVREKSVANYYIFNLALADEIYILTLPIFSFVSVSQDWVFGGALCTILNILHSINKFGSVFTLVALSMDRYIASFHNLGHFRTIRMGKAVCVGIWAVSLIMCMPDMLYSHTVPRNITVNGISVSQTSCQKIWPKNNLHRRVWAFSELTIGLIVPFCLILISYALLVHRLHAILKPRKSDRIRKPNRKMTRTILVVVIMFLLCNLPYYIIQILNVQKMEVIHAAKAAGRQFKQPSRAELFFYQYFNMTAVILVFISSCCNPIIYGALNENYRKLYRIALCCGQGGNRHWGNCFAAKGSYDSVTMSQRNNNTQVVNVSPARPSENVIVHMAKGDQCESRIAPEDSSFV